eukprot:15367038-Ditylum_brightwellii.AAC.1
MVTMVSKMVMTIVLVVVLMIVMTVLTSTSHISHKALIGILLGEEIKKSIVEDGVDSADKHLTHFSQGVDCHLTWKSKQNKHVVGNKDNDGDNSIQDGDYESVEDGVNDSYDTADKLLKHLFRTV